MSKNSTEVDEDGYLLLADKFKDKGYEFEFITNLEGGWKIYKKTMHYPKSKVPSIKYELVRPHKNEEYTIHGNTVPKKHSYPGDNAFGRVNFDCYSLDRAYDKHKELLKHQKEIATKEQEKISRKLKIPSSKTFTAKDVRKLNDIWSLTEIRNRLTQLVKEQKLIWVNEKGYVNKTEKIYKLAK